jgi:hypothetical protein
MEDFSKPVTTKMDLLATVWEKGIEKPLSMLGLMQSRVKRFTAFAAGTFAIVYLLKHPTLYDAEGNALPSLFYKYDRNAVLVNSATLSLLAGAASVIFI